MPGVSSLVGNRHPVRRIGGRDCDGRLLLLTLPSFFSDFRHHPFLASLSLLSSMPIRLRSLGAVDKVIFFFTLPPSLANHPFIPDKAPRASAAVHTKSADSYRINAAAASMYGYGLRQPQPHNLAEQCRSVRQYATGVRDISFKLSSSICRCSPSHYCQLRYTCPSWVHTQTVLANC